MAGTVTLPDPQLLNQAGALLWAPAGTSLPANTVVGGVFTDDWPVAWVPLGRTTSGTKIEDNPTVSNIDSAEDYYPLDSPTTARDAMVSFELMSNTATNLSRALNGAVTVVTGTTTTTLTQVSAPNPVNEVPCMIGWQSLDGTVRWVGYKVKNSANLSMELNKAPSTANIAWAGKCMKPATTQPYDFFYAGENRA
jgi:hypothetical protein